MSVKANCPACGGPLEFKVGTSLVTVCPYCQSVIGRGDRGLESLGKVADLVETNSPLDVGIQGRWGGVRFDLTGRTQFRHPMGGVWDEWYAAFTDGRWGWLAEAQGRFYLTFETPLPGALPSYDGLEVGQQVSLGNGIELTVAEKQRAHVGSARGEIPYRVIPGSEHPFADLSGPQGEFATLDYSGPGPVLYLGRQVTLDELQIPPQARRRYPGQEPTVKAVQLNCPKCGGQLSLRAPDQSERVGCPHCGSLLDVKEGNLKLLRSLQKPEVEPVIPLGAEGDRGGARWTAIGFMQRYVTIEGQNYYWEEYLLYQPRLGFRWLTRSDDHWNWVEPLPPGAVTGGGNYVAYAERPYRLFQRAKAKVDFVVGEFYWKVQAGETVTSRDYVNAPHVLSEEVTKEGKEGEVSWSLGTYLQPAEVERMFGLKGSLPSPQNIGPNQPFPHTGVYRSAIWLAAMAVVLGLLFWLTSPRRKVFEEHYVLKPLPAGQRTQSFTSETPLKLRRRANLRVTVIPKGGSWVHVDGTLTPAKPPPAPGETRRPAAGQQRRFAFVTPEAEPGWVYVGALPPGDYDLRFELAWKNPLLASAADVRIELGVAHPFLFAMVLLGLLAVPVAVGLYQLYWESARWAESSVGD